MGQKNISFFQTLLGIFSVFLCKVRAPKHPDNPFFMHELLSVKATFQHVEVVSDELDGEVMPPDSLEGDGHVHHGSCIIIDLCFVVAGGWDGCFLYKLEVVNSSFSRVKWVARFSWKLPPVILHRTKTNNMLFERNPYLHSRHRLLKRGGHES